MAKRQRQISVTVTEAHLEALARLSAESGRSPAEIAREALHRYLAANDPSFRASVDLQKAAIVQSLKGPTEFGCTECEDYG
jgi:hypothetical protein